MAPGSCSRFSSLSHAHTPYCRSCAPVEGTLQRPFSRGPNAGQDRGQYPLRRWGTTGNPGVHRGPLRIWYKESSSPSKSRLGPRLLCVHAQPSLPKLHLHFLVLVSDLAGPRSSTSASVCTASWQHGWRRSSLRRGRCQPRGSSCYSKGYVVYRTMLSKNMRVPLLSTDQPANKTIASLLHVCLRRFWWHLLRL